MTTDTRSNAKTSTDEAVKKAVADTPGATIEGIAKAAGIARSTAGKTLGRLADRKEITRHNGGRDAGKRLPDRFTLTGTKMPPGLCSACHLGLPGRARRHHHQAERGGQSRDGEQSEEQQGRRETREQLHGEARCRRER